MKYCMIIKQISVTLWNLVLQYSYLILTMSYYGHYIFAL